MNILKEIIKPTFVLVIICAVVASLLAFTYNVTGVGELGKGITQNDLDKYVYTVMPNATRLTRTSSTVEDKNFLGAYVDDSKNGIAVHLLAKGYAGADSLNLLVGFDKEGKVTGVQFISIAETPELGTKITEKSFTDTFTGKTPPLKIGEDIDAIAGATKSSSAFTNALNHAYEIFLQVKEEILA
ncbi:MAG: FMN-binding protein [Oscillospiraceae bacterium]